VNIASFDAFSKGSDKYNFCSWGLVEKFGDLREKLGHLLGVE